MKRLLFLTLPFLFFACAIPVRTSIVQTDLQPISPTDELIIVNEYENIPEGSELVGHVEAGGHNLGSGCTEQATMDELKTIARQQGANVLKIIATRNAVSESTFNCLVFSAGLYHNDSAEAIARYHAEHEALNASTLPEDADYALVHVYSSVVVGPGTWALKTNFYNNGARITRLRVGDRFTYQTTNLGLQGFGMGGPSNDVIFQVEAGQEYYLRLGAGRRNGGLSTTLHLVDNVVGREETKGIWPFEKETSR